MGAIVFPRRAPLVLPRRSPYALPVNLLTANQSTCGDAAGNITGFYARYGTVVRDASQAWEGAGCIRVTLPTGGEYTGVEFAGGYGVRVAGGEGYTMSAYMKGAGGGETVGFYVLWFCDATWLTNSGGSVGGSLTTRWARYSARFGAPEGANLAFLQVVKPLAAAAEVFFVDGLQFEPGNVATPWHGGGFVDPCAA